MAINKHDISIFLTSLSLFVISILVIVSVPFNLVTFELYIISIFFFSFTCSIAFSLALNLSLRWIKYTLLTMSDKYTASSTAVFPPPIMATSFFLKNAPSHVAQYDIPFPRYLSSSSIPNFLLSAPVAIITAFAWYDDFVVIISL